MTTELFGGADMRSVALLNALEETVYERGTGLPLPTILGTIELLKDLVKANKVEQNNRIA